MTAIGKFTCPECGKEIERGFDVSEEELKSDVVLLGAIRCCGKVGWVRIRKGEG